MNLTFNFQNIFVDFKLFLIYTCDFLKKKNVSQFNQIILQWFKVH